MLLHLTASGDNMNRAYKYLMQLALIVSGLCMFLILSLCTADVLAYLLLGKPFSGANEIVEVALAVCISTTIVRAHYEKSHIEVDLISQWFPKGVKRVTEFIALTLAVCCTGFLAYGAWNLAAGSVRDREAAITLYSFPIYPWKVLFALSISIAAAEALRQLVLTCMGKPGLPIGLQDMDQDKSKGGIA